MKKQVEDNTSIFLEQKAGYKPARQPMRENWKGYSRKQGKKFQKV